LRREENVKNVLICPIGFVSDHLEVLYDVDIECQRLAEEIGVRLARTESLNDDPQFIRTLADVVYGEAGGAEEGRTHGSEGR
jgi:protoporphyrin/coproporphyrin ferrochelatase